MTVKFLKTTTSSIEFEVSLADGKVEIHSTSPDETKKIQDVIFESFGVDRSDYGRNFDALEKACEIYYDLLLKSNS